MDREALLDAYLHRKKWEFRAQATAIVNLLGEAMSGRSSADGTYVGGHREISTDAMLERIGYRN